MSHQVTVDFEGVAITIQSQCKTAAHSLCKIDKTLDKIHQTADRLETVKVKKYEEYLLKAKDEIQRKIDAFTESLEEYKALKTQRFDADVRYGNAESKSLAHMYSELQTTIKSQGEDLERTVVELTGSKLAVLDQLIDDELAEAGSKAAQALIDKSNGVITLSKETLDKINSISDVSLRELTYREALKESNNGLGFDELLKLGQENYDILLGKKTAKVLEEYKEELKERGLPSEKIDEASSIDEAAKAANSALTDEEVRKQTLQVIVKAIKSRGFIVDTKKNLKIDRARNVLKLVALKASGQKAEFEIQINGKFMYHFDGYEGLACNKDIEPFMEDLQNIYDIKVLHEEVQWSNPDKISTQKYQYVNKNKGTN